MNNPTRLARLTKNLLSIPAILGMIFFPPLVGSSDASDEALQQALDQYIGLTQPAVDFQITQAHELNGFAYGIAEPFVDTSGQRAPDQAFVPLLAMRDAAGGWIGIAPRVVKPAQFNATLNSFPAQLLDENTKAFLMQPEGGQTEQVQSGLTVQAFSGYRLPWLYQHSSQLFAKGNCYMSGSGVSCDNSGHVDQLDFSIEGSSINGDIIASKPGTIVFMKESSSSGACNYDNWRQANMVVIQHADSEYSWYVHLAPNSIPDSLSVGSTVEYGTKVGVEGNTGYSCGPHLHFMTSTGHGTWTDPANPDAAPWATGITSMDFAEVPWMDLTIGNWYISQNASPELLPPNPPALTGPTDGQFFNEGDPVTLSWSGLARDFYGEVWGGPGGTTSFGWQSGLTRSIGIPTPGYLYSWHVKGRNDNGEGGWSLTSTFTVRTAAPQNLMATAGSCSSINLSWDDMSANEEGFRIFRDASLIAVVGNGVETFQDSGLVTNTSFTYFVKSYRGEIKSLASNTVSLDTGSCPPGAPALISPAQAAVAGRFDNLSLDWAAVSGASEYYAEFWGGPGTSANSGWISATGLNLGTDIRGGQYSWRVKARNSVGEGGWSPTWILYRKYGAPGALSSSAAGLTELTFTWSPSIDAPDHIDGYRIYRSGSDIAVTGPGTTQFTDTGRTCGTSYHYTVRAYGGGLESDASNALTLSTLPCPPGAFEKLGPADGAIDRGLTGLTLRWSPSDLADEYAYCLDKVLNSKCDTTWSAMMTGTSATLGRLEKGVTYYWQVRARNEGGVENANGGSWWSFTTRIPPPTNDNIEAAPPITSMPYGASVDTRAATEQAGDPALQACNRLPGKASIWYTYTPTRAGDLSLDTTGSDHDTMLAVWSGVPGSLAPIGCNDDIGMTTSGWNRASRLRAGLSKGITYYIEIAGYAGKIDPSIVPAGEVKDGDKSNGQLTFHAIFAPYPSPGAFGKLAPANNGLSQPTSLQLQWEASSNASQYRYCVDTIDDKACTGSWIATQSTSVLITGLDLDTAYYWQVKAVNAGGRTFSDSNTWWRFHVQPPAASLISPVNGTTPLTRRPTFAWEAVPGAESYSLQVSKYNDLSSPLIDASSVTTSYAAATNLPAASLLYWRVRVINGNGWSAWSPVWTLTIPNPPSVPVLISPPSGAVLSSYRPRLDWSDSAIPAGAPEFDHYRLQIAGDEGFDSILLDQRVSGLPADSEYTPEMDLPSDQQYWWRVRAYNVQGQYIRWSTPGRFCPALTAPVLLSPLTGDPVYVQQPTFNWQAANGAGSYRLQVSKTSDFSILLLNASSYGTSYTTTTILPKGVPLYWRVKINGSCESSQWSSAAFTIQ